MFSMRRYSLTLALLAGLTLGACSDSTAPTTPSAVPEAQNDNLPASSSYNPFSSVPVNGTYSGGTFVGIYTVLKFVVVDGKLKAEVRLKGKLLNLAGVLVSYVDVKLYVPIKVLSSSCTILKLEIAAFTKLIAGKQLTLSKCLIVVDPAKASLAIVVSLKLILCNITSALGGALHFLAGLLNQLLGLFPTCLKLICL